MVEFVTPIEDLVEEIMTRFVDDAGADLICMVKVSNRGVRAQRASLASFLCDQLHDLCESLDAFDGRDLCDEEEHARLKAWNHPKQKRDKVVANRVAKQYI